MDPTGSTVKSIKLPNRTGLPNSFLKDAEQPHCFTLCSTSLFRPLFSAGEKSLSEELKERGLNRNVFFILGLNNFATKIAPQMENCALEGATLR